MSKNTEASPRTFRKRYITIAALSALTITGGAIGATVTAESTIAGNKITITQHVNTPANIIATGNSLKVQFKEGEAPALTNIPGISDNAAGATKITLTNTGETDAVVKGVKVEGLNLPTATTLDSNEYVGFYLDYTSDTSKHVLRQTVAKGASVGNIDKIGEITVPAKGSFDVWAYFWATNGESTFKKLGAYDKTFDIKFDYTDKK